eukprot:12898699-Prorocentrum_lima.AAC.1
MSEVGPFCNGRKEEKFQGTPGEGGSMEASFYVMSYIVPLWWHFQCSCLAYHDAATFLNLEQWQGEVAIPAAWMPRVREEPPPA